MVVVICHSDTSSIEHCTICHLTLSLHALSPGPNLSSYYQMASVRDHRSGRSVRTDIPYKPKRTGLIPISESTEDLLAALAGSDRQRYFNLIELWQLYDRAEIIERLDVLSPRHGLKASGPKIPMLMKWTECQRMTENPEAMERYHRLLDPWTCTVTSRNKRCTRYAKNGWCRWGPECKFIHRPWSPSLRKKK